ncbi:NUDIX domain-containing protein [Nocardia yamanashiensis]|uniref:NUDIX domain-containing protein n=1 Tax=Nocardia yamanashiensis TaxID=209247 RepID=UPI000833C3E9|nr:NUDIX hydrolase [Nocardia yamanashiensis]
MDALSSREVYSNRWITVREDYIPGWDGQPSLYSVVEKSDFAVVIPFDGERFHLVEQYRYPIDQRSWEFPAGTVADEVFDAEAVARQELREETGLRAGRMTFLGKLAVAPSVCSHSGHVFLATHLTEGAHEREPSEQDMVSRWFTRAELERMIRAGEILDADTVAAYGMLLLHERGGE